MAGCLDRFKDPDVPEEPDEVEMYPSRIGGDCGSGEDERGLGVWVRGYG